jgi:hypothetical protein
MAVVPGDPTYSMALLRDVEHWSVPIALTFAIAGSAVTHDLRFGASCLIGAAVDIGTLAFGLHRVRGLDPSDALSSAMLLPAVIGRVVLKAVLLVVAFLLPAWLDLWGMAAGVLTVDLTLATAGSAASVHDSFRPNSSGP